MSLEENKKLVRRYFEDAPYNPSACDEIFAPRFYFHPIQGSPLTPQVVEKNPQGEKEAYAWLKAVWSSEYRLVVEAMMAENDRVMVCWTLHGTHQGEYLGLPPTQKAVACSGINLFRVEDGKIVEVWDLYDRLWLLQQLGVLPSIEEAIAAAKEKL